MYYFILFEIDFSRWSSSSFGNHHLFYAGCLFYCEFGFRILLDLGLCVDFR